MSAFIDLFALIKSIAGVAFFILFIYGVYLQIRINGWLKQAHPELSNYFSAASNLKCTKMLLFSSLRSISDVFAEETIKKIRLSFYCMSTFLLIYLICTICIGVIRGY